MPQSSRHVSPHRETEALAWPRRRPSAARDGAYRGAQRLRLHRPQARLRDRRRRLSAGHAVAQRGRDARALRGVAHGAARGLQRAGRQGAHPAPPQDRHPRPPQERLEHARPGGAHLAPGGGAQRGVHLRALHAAPHDRARGGGARGRCAPVAGDDRADGRGLCRHGALQGWRRRSDQRRSPLPPRDPERHRQPFRRCLRQPDLCRAVLAPSG